MDAPTRSSSTPHLTTALSTPRPPGNFGRLSYSEARENNQSSTSGAKLERVPRREHSDGDIYVASPEARTRRNDLHTRANNAFSVSERRAQQIDEFHARYEEALARRREDLEQAIVGDREIRQQVVGRERTIAEQAVSREKEVAKQVAVRRREAVEKVIAERKKRWEEHLRQRSANYPLLGNGEMSRVGMSNSIDGYSPPSNPNHPGHPLPPGGLDRPLPRRPNERHPADHRGPEIVLPRWQPDVDVHECPICHTTFTFFYRKHHCRRCGRVVCANCSPHRITIPRQFIVHPPEDVAISPEHAEGIGPTVVDLSGADETRSISTNNITRARNTDNSINPALGGGQEVRLCNPCVPDPNPMPPPSYHQPRRPSDQFSLSNQISSARRHGSRFSEDFSIHGPPPTLSHSLSGGLGHRSDERHRVIDTREGQNSRPLTQTGVASTTSNTHLPQHRPVYLPPGFPAAYGSAPDATAQPHFLETLNEQRRGRHHSYHRQHASLGAPNVNHRAHLSLPQDLETHTPRPIAQARLREEDECPICHGALPPKGPDGSETARETHVSECIELHFSTSTSSSHQPNPSAAIDAAIAATTATPSQANGLATLGHSEDSSQARRTATQQRRRTTGMVVYSATEKDCLGEDGTEAECVICFEEFSVGAELGRLECLCKFHKTCIRAWWDTKGPGACPVHQQQEDA